MKKKILFNEIAERTVEGFASSFDNHKVLISFKDDTFIVIGFVEGFHEEEDGIMDVELDTFNFYSDDLLSNIFNSKEEFASMLEATENRTKTLAETAERETYKD